MDGTSEPLKHINDRLSELKGEIKEFKADVYIKLSYLEKWVASRDRELDIAEDQHRMIDERLDEHQSYIDERRPLLGEFKSYKERVETLEKWVDIQKGAKLGVGDLISRIAMLLGIVAALYGIYKK